MRKKRWKMFLFGTAVIIVSVSLYYTNILVEQIRKNERNNVQIWADAIHRKANLVNFTNKLFEQIKQEERQRVTIVAEAQERILTTTDDVDRNFFLDIISNNTTIPVVLADKNGNIKYHRNVRYDTVRLDRLIGELKKEFSIYPPIIVSYLDTKEYLYYKDSNIFTELKDVLDDLMKSFFSEIVTNSASVPVIITDSTKTRVINYGNIPEAKMKDPIFEVATLHSMESQNNPIKINIANTGIRYIFYQDSFLLTQLKYYPFVQFFVIGIFLFIAYLLFSYARRSEQNQVWVGMAKETAHQLGTPMSSMVAWVELLKLKGVDQDTLTEIEKDVNRLETITDRFSKIGSKAKLESTDIVSVVNDSMSYIRSRSSQKVNFTMNASADVILVPINVHLFEWVIENICKNAVDAMEGNGSITIDINEDDKNVLIDIADTGKGIPKSLFKTIFRPGYTSKHRGWGLGLTLSKRIIENYHTGKIFVKTSAMNKGTTFRILLKK